MTQGIGLADGAQKQPAVRLRQFFPQMVESILLVALRGVAAGVWLRA